jgi:hypothetical protein
MYAQPGDVLVERGQTLSDPDREAFIVEVRHVDGSPPYKVRWADDGHQALVFPGPDSYVRHVHRASS